MCIICDVRKAATPVMQPQNAVHAIATAHRNVLAQQLANAPRTAAALFGEIPAEGCNAEMVLNGDISTGTQTLEVRIPDGDKGLRVTYASVDYTATVAYTGNGPAGQSHIGVDAIVSALDYIGSKETGLEAMLQLGILSGHTEINIQHELDMTQLVKRCLVALREHAEKPPTE